MIYKVETACEQGNVRPNNEDAIRYGIDSSLGVLWMIVADGMGGHKAGEIASEKLVEKVEAEFDTIRAVPSLGWKDWIVATLTRANSSIYQAAQTNPDYHGMGTTGVLLVCDSERAYLAWVGDSRAYHFRGNTLSQLTQDHSMIQYLLKKGSISSEEAARSNSKHLLSRAIGVKQEVEVDFVTQELQSTDVLLLSTDGVHDHLAEAVIAGYLTKSATGKAVCDEMTRQAMVQGSRDNLTLGIVNFSD
ncbi:Stp1/IreP family PP2C-type Ser/Thr phosphatase [Aliikangiella coralliicola]|uniref:Stp1/IreP family PP2C-type Ser/Thr phosphatase n=1 Tax=Aliikangiella coralliicola TaxID=2592383 RepID=A0A545UHH5_9GAMM|nr:Stp1/IreP family PP2C-type Ser/Thr phosphatase [Aliikangiella coralliicola]TQV88863.1 Stp1/IreP family PP2C-type Ser/Thr phosphatase [Aliikangiella coralliicola]